MTDTILEQMHSAPIEARLAAMKTIDPQDYFLPYQRDWINDDSDMKLYEKSRRVGITYSTSYRAHMKCMNNPGMTQWVSSRDELTAKEFITDYIQLWCKLVNVVAVGILGDNQEVVNTDKDIKAFVVTYPNGSRIVSLSSNPHAFAGKGGDVLLDECDLHQNQEDLIAMAMPCAMWGGQVEIVSAYDPKGSENTAFATLVRQVKNGERDGWSLHTTTLQDAVSQGLAKRIATIKQAINGRSDSAIAEQFIQKQRNSCRVERDYLSQYCCIPNSSSGFSAIKGTDLAAATVVIPGFIRIHIDGDAKESDTIDPSVAKVLETEFWQHIFIDNHQYSLGYDVGRRSDLSAIPIFKTIGGKKEMVAMITMSNCKFASQRELIRQLFIYNRKLVGAGDETGLGMNVCEDLRTEFGERFMCVNFASSKNELGQWLTYSFENGLVSIPKTYSEIGADFKCIEVNTTISGKLTYTATANRELPESHADLAWAGALALLAERDLKPSLAAGMTISQGGRYEDESRMTAEETARREDYKAEECSSVYTW